MNMVVHEPTIKKPTNPPLAPDKALAYMQEHYAPDKATVEA